MRQAEQQVARKEYKCQRCHGKIKKGQEYKKKNQSGRVHNRMTYWNITWHANKEDCK